MFYRCARLASVSRRHAQTATNLRPSLALLAAGPRSAPSTLGHDDAGVARAFCRQPRAGLSAAAAAVAPRVADVKEEKPQVMRTPPMVEEDSGPPIREMRVQLRPESEHGSRGARRVRRSGKIPGIVYSNNDSSVKGSRGETFCVKVDRLVVDREIRRLKAAFDNTVYDLVIEGARPAEEDEAEVEIKLQGEGEGASEGGDEGGALAANAEGAVDGQPERRELVLANGCRLHPVFRTVLSVNWMRYKAGRKYPIPVKFINDDLNDNFRKGAYIRRLKTHQHIILPDDPEKVPRWLYLDLEFVRSGSKLRVSDIMIPEGIRFFRGNEPDMWNEVVCTIKGRKVFTSGGDEEDEEEED